VHPQLKAIADELEAAHHRLTRLAARLSPEQWGQRRDPDRWSAAECITHLNLTAEAYRPIVSAALNAARRRGGPPPSRLRRDPIGWLLWTSTGEPARRRFQTTAPFVPREERPIAVILEAFDRLQDEQLSWVRDAEGLPIHRVRVVSAFNPKIRYSLYSCLTILSRHQHRHLWQAEQVWPDTSPRAS